MTWVGEPNPRRHTHQPVCIPNSNLKREEKKSRAYNSIIDRETMKVD